MLIIVDNVQVNSGGDLGPFEPINSIPQAFDTGLDGGGLTTLSAFVGDGEFGATSGDYDFFSISADDGDTITIETFSNSLGTGRDRFVGLYDSSGNLLAADDGSFGFDSFLSFEVSTYTKLITHHSYPTPLLPLLPWLPLLTLFL